MMKKEYKSPEILVLEMSSALLNPASLHNDPKGASSTLSPRYTFEEEECKDDEEDW